mmetsp:Transcript_7541/g.16106  ORF Transcript_7541/g.16106 Transcript_7541/m.16106 type:complete len:627 (-) Transcript_7541:1323-3203(-)
MIRSTVVPSSGSLATWLKLSTPGRACPCPSTLASPGPPPPKLLVISLERSRYMLGSLKSSTPDSISHGQIWTVAPSQNWPLPSPWIRTSRPRRLMPSHCDEQAVQADQSSHWQSMLGVHAIFSLQLLCSMDSPTAGTPQSFASTFTLRTRQVSPPSHEAEHASQSVQSAHWPSVQTFSWQRWVLHGSISSLALASQGLHPGCGALTMWRSRVRWPPSQGALQLLHSNQSAQRQSTHWHSSRLQGRASLSCWWQPSPSSFLRGWKSRLRASRPLPHVVLQADHGVHAATTQSTSEQGCVLQPRACMSSSGHFLPPFRGFVRTARWRMVWPPLHVLSHSSHCVHSLATQSTVWLQCRASRREPLQGLPVAEGSSSILRSRYFMASSSHSLQGCHAPRTQSMRSILQGTSLQASISSRAPTQDLPPCPAGTSTRRPRVCRPPPQSSEHFVQGVQAESSHSFRATFAWTLLFPSKHGTVSLTAPVQAAPPFEASRCTLRCRSCCPFSRTHSAGVQAPQAPKAQSTGSEQFFAHSFVSIRAPSQGAPSQEDSVATLRRRSQSCSQEGSDHSDHSDSAQACGTHWSSHGLKGHVAMSTWLPLQGLLLSAWKKLPLPRSETESVSWRWRLCVW